MSPGKDIPYIEFGPVTAPNGVVHVVPAIKDAKGEKRIMKGHNFNGGCCQIMHTHTPNGAQMVVHSVIH